MKLVLLGPPGAGKGTHAKILCERFNLTHLAAGDIFRRNIRENTELGRKAKDTIEKGHLVPDDLVNEMMFREIENADRKNGFVLDGYPRTIGQAEALDAFCARTDYNLDVVLNFDTSENVIIDRLSGRRVNPTTGRVYHVRNMPPKVDGICDETGEKLVTRKDDQPETIKKRLEVYEKETQPLIDFYKKKGLLQDVPGDYDVPELQAHLNQIFERLNLAV
ncbi:MAG: adenylate kinase [Candidatus Omnitrophica bacterium]|nr:adenylate kinase [Candidatus Omnitrophota bacterium]